MVDGGGLLLVVGRLWCCVCVCGERGRECECESGGGRR